MSRSGYGPPGGSGWPGGADRGPERHGRGRGGGRGGRRGRLFAHGDLHLMVLWLIGEKPSHGYELIKSIEAQAGGAYSPSPGTIYPALAFLEDRGYVQAEEPAGSRRLFAITPAGRAYLAASREQVEALFGRIREHRTAEPDVPAPVMRAMENLTLALRMRLERGLLSPAEAHAIAGILDQAAQSVERT